MEKLPFSPEKGKASTLRVCCTSLLLKLLFKSSTPGRVKWINYITKILPRIPKSRTEKYCFSRTFKLFSVLIWKICDTRWIKSLYLASREIINLKRIIIGAAVKNSEKCVNIHKLETKNPSVSAFWVLSPITTGWIIQDLSGYPFCFWQQQTSWTCKCCFRLYSGLCLCTSCCRERKNTQLLKLRIRKYHW